MKRVLALCLLVAGCSDGEAEMFADMSPPERASYGAIKAFDRCMEPHIEAAKLQKKLSDQEVDEIGLKCPKELEQVAQAMAKRPLSSFHGSISRDEWISDFDKRVAHIGQVSPVHSVANCVPAAVRFYRKNNAQH